MGWRLLGLVLPLYFHLRRFAIRYADNHCQYEEEYTEQGHFYVYTGPCVMTGEQVTVRVPAESLFKYRQGALMQNAFPEMSSDDREFLISGMSAKAWAQTFE